MDARILIVDDSAVMRQALTAMLSGVPGMRVIGQASDPVFARHYLEQEWPDVIVLDIEMPRIDGLTFLRQVMRERPTPVVICSGLTEHNVSLTLEALHAGAVSVVCKPTGAGIDLKSEQTEAFRDAIREAVAANVRRLQGLLQRRDPTLTPSRRRPTPPRIVPAIVAIGISTGGPRTLEELLSRIHGPVPPIFVVQHMPVGFTAALARRLDGLTPLSVSEARDGELLRPDHVYIAPAGLHSEVRASPTGGVTAHVRTGVRVSQHIPSVDVLFESVAAHIRRRSVGIVMTGMGNDGARGLRLMREAGALTVAQDEHSSVVYGMPRAAVESGAAEHVADVRGIAELLGSLRGARADSARSGPSPAPAQRV